MPPTISWEEFAQLAASCNIREEASLKRATRFLHETGSLIYFEVLFDLFFHYHTHNKILE
jgi:hypothetical protein